MPGLALDPGGSVPEKTASPRFGLGLWSGCLSLAGFLLGCQLSDAQRQSGVRKRGWTLDQTDEAEI